MNAAAVYSCGCGQSSAAGQCLNALRGAGIRVGNQVEERGRRSVLLFEEPGDEVCRLLRETCGGGRNRVLAVALARPLRAGETDNLLATGAADVLVWREAERDSLAASIKARLDRWATVDALLDSDWLQRRMVGGSELFGHEQGSFTGATGQREGAVALAYVGTFFKKKSARCGRRSKRSFFVVLPSTRSPLR